MFQCVCRWDRADNYRAEEQRKVKVDPGKFWSVCDKDFVLSVSQWLLG